MPQDPRIVYGARCAWWDSIDKVSTTATGLPVCPHCASPLFEIGSEAEWWLGVQRHEEAGNPGYRAFVVWLRGKCFPGLEAAAAAYQARTRATIVYPLEDDEVLDPGATLAITEGHPLTMFGREVGTVVAARPTADGDLEIVVAIDDDEALELLTSRGLVVSSDDEEG